MLILWSLPSSTWHKLFLLGRVIMLEETKLPVLIILSLITSCFSQVQSQSDCTNPDGDAGICVSIMDCQALFTLVQKEERTKEELNFLRQSRCGVMNETLKVKVCCAINDTQCYNPDGNLGHCVGYSECPSISKILQQPPVSTENIDFIRDSRCEGPAKYSVCCGPDHTKTANVHSVCEPSPAPPDPRTQCCGLDNSSGNKIIGGIPVALDQYPWLILIEYKSTTNNKTKLLCGGSLISSKYVLTAGHCVRGAVLKTGKPENIRLGEYDISKAGPDCVTTSAGQVCTDGPVTIPIQKIIPHRDYDPESTLRRNDIALIRMTNNVQYTDFIRPICLPTIDITQSNQNLDLYAAGWGAVSASQSFSNIKLHVRLPYKPLEQCQAAYNIEKRKLKLWNGQICAGGEIGMDTCRGDSGGPLMYDDGTTYSIVGVVSFGPTPCALKDVPGVYTKVYEYMPWIRSNIKP